MRSYQAALRDRVVVITGASSGLGREVALQFATAGCNLVLAARREEDLNETGQRCRERGASALSVPADVSVEADVRRVLAAALSAYGRVDVWINDAGVTLFAKLSDAPFEEHRRVIEINLFGAMLAAQAVIPVFRRQRRGVLINVGSVLSKVGQPFVPSYVISKFGLRGMSEALRTELADEPDIHVCTVLPFSIDTPHFQSGASEIPQQARAIPPVQAPEAVARAILQLAVRPRREVHVPRVAALGLFVRWLLPVTTEQLLLRTLSAWHFDDQPQPSTTGNLYQPLERGAARVHGQRTPLLATRRFALWTGRELGRIELGRLLGIGKRARSRSAEIGP